MQDQPPAAVSSDPTLLARDLLGARGLGEFGPFAPVGPFPDAPDLAIAKDSHGRPALAVLRAPRFAPRSVREAAAAAARAAAALGPELGARVVQSLAGGEQSGLTFEIYPYCTDLRKERWWRWVQDARLRGSLFRWLREATRVTARPPSPEWLVGQLLPSLLQVAADPVHSAELRAAAARAAQRTETGEWRPVSVLLHNDLWRENIMLREAPEAGATWSSRLAFIDWRSSTVEGHGVYDLMRFSESLGLSRMGLRKQLLAHCGLLGCAPLDAAGHLLAAFGRIGRNLDQFPPNAYANLCQRLFARLQAVLPETLG